MFKIRTLFYSLGQGIKNLGRNRMFSLASIGTMTACLFLFGIFYFLLVNLQQVLIETETNVGITVFFEDGSDSEQIELIGQQILKNEKVEKIEYLSAEEAWTNYKNEYLTEELAESFGSDNPLADSASYTVYTTQVEYQKQVADYLAGIEGIRQVNSSQELATTLQGINRAVSYLSLAIIVILLAVAAFLIGITISMGISVRKEEISIMKLIGAADYFIRGPYIVEGVLLGLIGSILPLLLLGVLYRKLTEYIAERFYSAFATFHFVDSATIFAALVPISLLIGLGIGFLGSYITSSRQLQKIN